METVQWSNDSGGRGRQQRHGQRFQVACQELAAVARLIRSAARERKSTVMVETATPADYPAIAELNLRAYFEYSAKLPAGSWEIMLPNLVNVVERAHKSQFYVVREGTRLVASVAYCPAGSGDSTVFRDNETSVLLLAVGLKLGAGGKNLISISLLVTCSKAEKVAGRMRHCPFRGSLS
jgi:hypothetical protein